uniref:Ribophorin II n=1 Tax=Globisporangium ultimum (strain ATCC 200006 / CBS 805.95 / DAOM BR144) TaxID=431595 RepID=K3X631_GLOUD
MASFRKTMLQALAAVALAASAAHAASFGVALASSKVALSKGALELGITLSPAQPDVKELTIDTLVDTTGTAILSNLKVAGNGEKFVAVLDGDKKLAAGMYKLKVTAEKKEKIKEEVAETVGEEEIKKTVEKEVTKEVVSEVLQVKVTVPVVVASAELNGLSLALGETVSKQEFSSGSGDALRVEVKLQRKHDKSPVTAHQAFLRFTHKADKVDTYFVLTTDKKKTHSAFLQFSTLSKKFGYKSGVYKLQLILGDPTFEKSIVWDLGELDLLLASEPPPTPSPLYAKHLLHESDTTLKALREIKHIMRPQDPRPPITVSLAFTGAVLVPLAVFLIIVLKLQLNISKLFQGSVFIFGSGFLATLAAIFALFGWYWLELTMFRTLGYLAVLGTANLWFGLLTLKRLAADDAKAGKKAKHE